MQHWSLTRDPFAELGVPYVALPSHEEAVARLIYSVETSQRRVILAAPEGLGKTTVLRKALAEIRSSGRRFALVSCPRDGVQLLSALAERLGAGVCKSADRLAAWSVLERAVKARSLEGFQVILAVDHCDAACSRAVRRDLEALVALGLNTKADLTLIQAERSDLPHLAIPSSSWTLAVGLEPLTVSEAKQYLLAKLSAAGSQERIFTPRAITRLQCLSRGVPSGLERLASLSLIAGAVRGLEVISPDVVDSVAQVCCRAVSAG
jgi:type II secretory pathway predicted ATPase ExeA